MKNVQAILKRMAELMRLFDYKDESIIFEKAAKEIQLNPIDVRDNLLSWYAGMGSLNDLVLQKNGEIPYNENEEFDNLKDELYVLLKNNFLPE